MRRLLFLILVTGLAALAWGIGLALSPPVVARYAVVIPGLAERVRIVQLSDTHGSGLDMPPRRLAGIVDLDNIREYLRIEAALEGRGR